MKRRVLLASLGASAVFGLGGCIGGGSEVVTTVQRTVRVEPGQGWVERVPDVSDPGGAIQYKVSASQPFDVYFFTSEESYMFYDTFVDGGDPAGTPPGDRDVGTAARRLEKDAYRATTKNEGGREPVDASGPYFFVVDHSRYRGERPPGEQADPLSAFVDLTVTKKKFGL